MNPIKPDTENDVLCHCSGTTVQQIKQLLNDGIVDPERISRITGTASGCGGCEFDLQQLLDEHH
jgi:bacterioferritin-associated ferredoxin